ncbi:deoxyribodipyrimidine photo-lyase type I [Magnetococcus marinus MC-1]|uniref:Deoxyribodipyrimidine photo-lyase n=1 Tax=Magnetococcus marinus (strain ATCC BAA-1437 / JCM 17883 / MC-1) TaxID=156889 RepID=A0L6R4_MAGMM|nr:deoxyribodipyrimidine photo-lyase [Magnetococcus marinus]ABK43657.1 deoxyribodipyrimidine photo-lyase type I [Magnetococcus marinus MC-1]
MVQHSPTVIVWFRRDLRLSDNPALLAATAMGQVLPVYIHENNQQEGGGGAWRWGLQQALAALNADLQGKLCCYVGDPARLLPEVAHAVGATGVYWNRLYTPQAIKRDRAIKQSLIERGLQVRSFNGSLLWEPWQVLKADKTPYKVFTPYYRRGCLVQDVPRQPMDAPPTVTWATLPAAAPAPSMQALDALLLGDVSWHKKWHGIWSMGEEAAQTRFEHFLSHGLACYDQGRDFPGRDCTSRLSTALQYGLLSPNQVWYGLEHAKADEHSVDKFRSELAWREFAYYQLFHFPSLPHKNFQPKFDHFPWLEDEVALGRWQTGQTGIPIVDAGMRELWQTGVMHNRVRMLVGSFLVKNLLLDWRAGAAWFKDCLVDYDLAINSASWQWVAGCGADAAPYFRIFNPVTQGEKFDRNGTYTRRFVPELANLPDQYLFKPWMAPASILRQAGVRLGQDYPEPLVDLAASRAQALAAFQALKI